MSTETMREPLSRDRVLAAAMEIADGDGLRAVTMRRVAADLRRRGDVALPPRAREGRPPRRPGGRARRGDRSRDRQRATRPAPTATGRRALRQRCLSARDVMERHPWAPGLVGSRTTIPVALYAYYEEILATLVGGGFSYHLAHRALHALGSMALGFAQELFSPAPAGGEFDEEAAAAELAQMAEVMPHLSAMVAAELHDHEEDPLGWCDSRAEFEFTLDLLLDGLARARG